MSAGNKELVKEMIEIFTNQVNEFASGMDQLYAEKSFEDLGRLAHKAKSSISIMGLSDLAVELKTFETKARAGEEPEKYPQFIEHFKKETQEALAELEDVLNNLDLYI